ncbi:MAG: hypothetical protein V1702_03860 [Candidatus Woesearchaeota archaeon]
MGIVGFSFKKILVERSSVQMGKLSIKNNVSLVEAAEAELVLGATRQKGIKFSFEFTVNYEPKVGQMAFNGEILYISEPKKDEEILKSWKKDKKLPKELTEELVNTILMRCNLEAMILGRDVNLPLPLPIPTAKLQ